jgi:hypothetical protein
MTDERGCRMAPSSRRAGAACCRDRHSNTRHAVLRTMHHGVVAAVALVATIATASPFIAPIVADASCSGVAGAGDTVVYLPFAARTASPSLVAELPPEHLSTIVVSGRHAYVVADGEVAGRAHVQVVDVADPARPRLVGRTERFSLPIAAVAVDTDRLYVLTRTSAVSTGQTRGALHLLDVSSPGSPRRVHALPTEADALAASGGFVYLDGACGAMAHGLVALDARDAAHPREAGCFADEPAVVVSPVAVMGEHLLVQGRARRTLQVLDVGDPARPVAVGPAVMIGAGMPYGGNAIAVAERRVYVVTEADDFGTGSLEVWDFADPAQPALLGTERTPVHESVRAVAATADRVYVATEGAVGSALRVYSVTDPAAPTVAAEWSSAEDAAGVATDGTGRHVYVVDPLLGLRVLRVELPDLIDVGRYRTLGSTSDVSLRGDTVFVAAAGGMSIVDLADPARPREVGFLGVDRRTRWVKVVGDTAYLVSWEWSCRTELHVVDVAERERPRLVRTLPLVLDEQACNAYFDFAGAFDIVGDTAWAGPEGVLVSLDVAGADAPSRRATLALGVRTWGIAIDGERAVVVVRPDPDRGTLQLVVVDIGDPDHPREIGRSAEVPGVLGVVAVDATHAYVASPAGLTTFDIADPAAPRQVGARNDLGQITSLRASAGTVWATTWIADEGADLLRIDVTDPSAPVVAGRLRVPSGARVVEAGRLVILAGVGPWTTDVGLVVVAPDGVPGNRIADAQRRP